MTTFLTVLWWLQAITGVLALMLARSLFVARELLRETSKPETDEQKAKRIARQAATAARDAIENQCRWHLGCDADRLQGDPYGLCVEHSMVVCGRAAIA